MSDELDDFDREDYRTHPECRKILEKIEHIVTKKKGVRTRFINQQITIPRGWNLLDIIADSKVIEFEVDAPRPRIILKSAVVGLPKADDFSVGKAADRTVAELGL